MALALLSVLAYAPGFWWGAPRAIDGEMVRSWGVDDEAPLGPLAQVHNILEPVPPEARNLGYPLLHSFLVAGSYAPYLGWLKLRGGLATPSASYPYGLADPVRALRHLTWIAHLVSVLLGSGVVVLAYVAGRELWDEAAGLLGAGFTLVSYPMFYYSRAANVDIAMLFFLLGSLAVYARILRAGIDFRRMAWLGVLAGCAVATKEPIAASFLGIPFVLALLEHRRRDLGGIGSRRFWAGAVLGLGGFGLAFALGSGLLVDPDRFFAHVEFVRGRMAALEAGAIEFVQRYPRTQEGHARLAILLGRRLVDSTTLPAAVLSLFGLAAAARARRPAVWFVVPAATYLLVLFWSARIVHLRYVLPAALPLLLFAGHGTMTLLRSRNPAVRVGAGAAAAAVLCLGALRGADLTWEMIRDSRYAAGEWLERNALPGDRIEFFGPSAKLPPFPDGIRYGWAAEYRGAATARPGTAEDAERILAGWRERVPDFVLIMPDVSSPPGVPHNVTCPPELFGALMRGERGYRLAAEFRTPRLFPWLPRPSLDYPSVNPPIRIFVPSGSRGRPGPVAATPGAV